MLHSNLRVSVIVLILFQGLSCLPKNVYKCENKSEWKLINYGSVGLIPPQVGAKILQATKDSCVTVPVKIEAKSILELTVYVNTTIQESGITILVLNGKQNVPAVEYTYGKSNEDFSLGWHTILLTIENDIDGYICLLGSSLDNEATLIDSVLMYKYDGISTKDNSRTTPLRIHDSIKNYIENNKSNITNNKETVDVKDSRKNKEHAYKYDSSNGNDENINRKDHQHIIEKGNTETSLSNPTSDNSSTDESTTHSTTSHNSITYESTRDSTTSDNPSTDESTTDSTTSDSSSTDESTTVTTTTTTQDPAPEDNSFWSPLTIGLVAAGSVAILAVVFVIAYNCGKEKGIEQTYGNLNGVKAENIIDPPSKRIVPRVKNIYKEGENPSNPYKWYN